MLLTLVHLEKNGGKYNFLVKKENFKTLILQYAFCHNRKGEKMLSFMLQNFFPLCSLRKNFRHSGSIIDKLWNNKFIFMYHQWRRTRWCHWCHGTTCFLVSKSKKVSKVSKSKSRSLEWHQLFVPSFGASGYWYICI